MKKKKSKEERLNEKILFLKKKAEKEIEINYKYLFLNLKNTKTPKFNKSYSLKLLNEKESNKIIMDLYTEKKENVIMLAKEKLINKLFLIFFIALTSCLITNFFLDFFNPVNLATENGFINPLALIFYIIIAILILISNPFVILFWIFPYTEFIIFTTLLIFSLQIIKYKKGKTMYIQQKDKIEMLVNKIKETQKEQAKIKMDKNNKKNRLKFQFE
jgi:hypothetical protein